MSPELQIERKKFYFSVLYSTCFSAVLLLFWIADHVFHLNLYRFGIEPRSFNGLVGIIAAPLIHGDFLHWVNNAFPLITLGILICYFYRGIAFRVFISIYILTGALVWLFARGHTYHIGASGLVYSFVAFVFFSGLIRKNYFLFVLSAIVLSLYSGLFPGILPTDDHISWESHLVGSFAGIAIAFYYRKAGPPDIKYDLDEDEEEEEDENDDGEWKNYPREDGKNTNEGNPFGSPNPFPPLV